MLATAPGSRATVEVAFAVMAGIPRRTRVGKVRIVPPPAMAFITPAPKAETTRARIWIGVMRPWISRVRTIHPDELTGKRALSLQGLMDPAGLSGKVGIVGTDNDPRMVRPFLVEPDEVLSVQRNDGALLVPGEIENLFVGESQAGLARFLNRQNVVAEPAQLLGRGPGEIFVGVEPGHPLRRPRSLGFAGRSHPDEPGHRPRRSQDPRRE